MTVIQAIILGIVQGLTEFLPVSSSGHLAIGQKLFGFEEHDVFFDIVLHVGTLLAVVYYYRRDLLRMADGLFTARVPGTRAWSLDNVFTHPGRWMVFLIMLGTLVTGVIGITGKERFESAFTSMSLVSVMFLVTAALVASTWFSFKRATGDLTVGKVLLIGIAQALAILPGVSRSGATIAVAMGLKVVPEEAARFSFLLSIPAILGALVMKADEVVLSDLHFGPLFAGFISSALVGLFALWLLVRLVKGRRLHWFAIWCLVASLVSFTLA